MEPRKITPANAAPMAPKEAPRPKTVLEIIDENKKEMIAGAPEGYGVSIDRLRRILITELKRNPVLAKADPYSLVGAVIQANQLGLEIGSGLGQAYLVPFSDKGVSRVQMILGYQGMIELAFRSGKVDNISADCVYEKDVFEYYMEDGVKRCKWIPLAKGEDKVDGKIVTVIACAKIKGGGVQYVVMDIDEILAVEKEFRKGQYMSKPWRDNFPAMARKTALRRLFTLLPKSAETRDMMNVTAQESGDFRHVAEQNLKNVTPIEEASEETNAIDSALNEDAPAG